MQLSQREYFYNYDDDTVSNTGHQEQSKSKSVDSIYSH